MKKFELPPHEHANHFHISSHKPAFDIYPVKISTVPSIPGEALANDAQADTRRLVESLSNILGMNIILPTAHPEGEI